MHFGVMCKPNVSNYPGAWVEQGVVAHLGSFADLALQ